MQSIEEKKAKKAAYDKQYRQDNKAKLAAYRKQYYQDNKEEKAQWYQDNKEKVKKRNKQYRIDNKEYFKQYRQDNKEYFKQHYQDNKPTYFAYEAKRRSLKKEAILPSSCPKAIQLFYDEAQEISNILGIKMHVDHIRPLSKGGAHHQDNLQVITWCENLSKGSSWDGVSGKGIDDEEN